MEGKDSETGRTLSTFAEVNAMHAKGPGDEGSGDAHADMPVCMQYWPMSAWLTEYSVNTETERSGQ